MSRRQLPQQQRRTLQTHHNENNQTTSYQTNTLPSNRQKRPRPTRHQYQQQQHYQQQQPQQYHPQQYQHQQQEQRGSKRCRRDSYRNGGGSVSHSSSSHHHHHQSNHHPHHHSHHQSKTLYHHPQHHHRRHQPPQGGATTIDIGLSDTTTDTQSYDYYYEDGAARANGFRHSPLRESMNTDVTFSDESGSTRLPYIDFDDESNKRYSRNTVSERSYKRPRLSPNLKINHIVNNKDLRKVYPNQDVQWEQMYQEIQTPCDNVPVTATTLRRIPTRNSDRPQSSMSSGVTSAIVHGCGGKCQTFENICYFFLQLMFTMGILIGVSLCIAGIVLRESAARHLQVLVYIGVLLAAVCALLLAIQCNARISANKRKKAIQMATRAPMIPMENLTIRTNPLHQQQQQPLIMGWNVQNQRMVQIPQVHGNAGPSNRPLPERPDNHQDPESSIIEEPGIPWWRRKDLNTHQHH